MAFYLLAVLAVLAALALVVLAYFLVRRWLYRNYKQSFIGR